MQVFFRFYAELNDFLPPAQRQVAFAWSVIGHPSIKDTIEALGVPHTEVDLILVEGQPVDFAYQPREGEVISVYPAFEELDIRSLTRLRPELPNELRFILDAHLGRLAAYLRLLGFDCLYQNNYADEELAQISAEEKRILLTRDRGLLKRSRIVYGYSVRSTDPRAQVKEVLRRFNLSHAVHPFSRCLRCNGLLTSVPKEQVGEQLPANTQKYYQDFYRCSACGHVYWRGSHYEAMQQLLTEFIHD